MLTRRSRIGYFVLEGLNSLGSVYFLYYLYFFMQKEYGFGNRANLALAAWLGLIYAAMSWQAGRVAQRFGYFAALKLGFGVMIAGWLMGSQLHTLAGHVAATSLAMAGTCFIWPALEALVTERETQRGVQRMVGIYNIGKGSTQWVDPFTADGCAGRVLLRPAQRSERHGLVVSQAGGRREVRDYCGPGACEPMYGDLAGDGPGLAGKRVHDRCATQARLFGLLGSARASPGGAGGCLWSAPGRAPRRLVSGPPRPPWRLALAPGKRLRAAGIGVHEALCAVRIRPHGRSARHEDLR
jgi:hypothetical protein